MYGVVGNVIGVGVCRAPEPLDTYVDPGEEGTKTIGGRLMVEVDVVDTTVG